MGPLSLGEALPCLGVVKQEVKQVGKVILGGAQIMDKEAIRDCAGNAGLRDIIPMSAQIGHTSRGLRLTRESGWTNQL
eukprot:5850189-Karenia_brevis.AAC.1